MTAGFRLHRNAAVRRRRPPREPAPVITIQVDRDLWAAALAVAGGDARRVEVLSQHQVIVWNTPRKKKPR